MTTPFTFLTLEIAEALAIVTVNRPDKLNALNATVIAELDRAFTELSQREQVRAIILTGAGRAFVAGADIAELGQSGRFDAQEILRRGELDVAGLAGEGGDRHPRPFGERGVVGEVVARRAVRASMRIDDRGELKRLWRLHRTQQRTIERAGDEALRIHRLDRVGDRRL